MLSRLDKFNILYLCLFDVDSYASGGEDGYTRVHLFDAQYLDFELEF